MLISMWEDLLYVVYIFSSFALTGLILLVQFVHYPAFRYIGKKDFPAFHQFHSRSISYIVIPLMLVELVAAFYLWLKSDLFWYHPFLVVLIWFSTFFWSVPIHKNLAGGHDAREVQRLIQSNWPRTLLWSLKSFLLIGGML